MDLNLDNILPPFQYVLCVNALQNVLSMIQTEDQWKTELVADEYMGTSGDRLKVREGLAEVLGDVSFAIPAIKVANYHRGKFLDSDEFTRT